MIIDTEYKVAWLFIQLKQKTFLLWNNVYLHIYMLKWLSGPLIVKKISGISNHPYKAFHARWREEREPVITEIWPSKGHLLLLKWLFHYTSHYRRIQYTKIKLPYILYNWHCMRQMCRFTGLHYLIVLQLCRHNLSFKFWLCHVYCGN